MKNCKRRKKAGKSVIYEFLFRLAYLLLSVMLSVAVLVVVSSISLTANNGKEMHVHAIFTWETAIAINLYVVCFVNQMYFIVLSKTLDTSDI